MERLEMNGNREQSPMPFIVGLARSGTTLLRLMLDRHPELSIPAETHFLGQLVNSIAPTSIGRDEFYELLTKAPTWPNMALDAADFLSALARVHPFSVSEGIRTFYRLYALKQGKTRWGDKTPPYRSCLVGISRLLSEAHFIHIIRDGRDIAVSSRGLWFGPGNNIEDQARFWVDQISVTRRQSIEVPYFLEVKYEDLISAPRRTLERICEFICVTYDPTMLRYYETAGFRLREHTAPFGPPGRTPPPLDQFLAIHENTKRPPDEGRIGRWRREMSLADQRKFEAIASDLLLSEGYETRFFRG